MTRSFAAALRPGLAAVVIAAGLALASPTAALAAPALTLNPSSGAPGDQIIVAGYGFPADRQTTIRWDPGQADQSDLGVATAGPNGDFSIIVTIPAAGPGAHQIGAFGSRGSQAKATFSLVATPSPSSSISPSPSPSPTPTPSPTPSASSSPSPPAPSSPSGPTNLPWPLALGLALALIGGVLTVVIRQFTRPSEH